MINRKKKKIREENGPKVRERVFLCARFNTKDANILKKQNKKKCMKAAAALLGQCGTNDISLNNQKWIQVKGVVSVVCLRL